MKGFFRSVCAYLSRFRTEHSIGVSAVKTAARRFAVQSLSGGVKLTGARRNDFTRCERSFEPLKFIKLRLAVLTRKRLAFFIFVCSKLLVFLP